MPRMFQLAAGEPTGSKSFFSLPDGLAIELSLLGVESH